MNHSEVVHILMDKYRSEIVRTSIPQSFENRLDLDREIVRISTTKTFGNRSDLDW